MGSKRRKPSKLKALKRKIESNVLGVFLDNPNKTLNYKQVSDKLNEKDSQIRLIIAESLTSLAAGLKLKEMDSGQFKLAEQQSKLKVGTIDVSKRGIGFFCSDELKDDIKIDNRDLNHALRGDIVKVKISDYKGKIKAKVVEIIERKKTVFAGRIDISEKYAFLISDDASLYVDIYVPLHKTMNANNGDKVAVQIEDWPIEASSPFGKVIEVLGKPGEHAAEINGLLFEFDLSNNFPEEVVAASEAISSKITEEDLSYRKDMRDVLTFTIDPHDAKDFDDAISFKKKGEDSYEIGVHIADVAHYVKEDSVIDKEAVKRATSVYLVNKVVPMLPEVLSNNLCSLRPNEDKLCFSIVFEIDKNAKIKDYWIGRTAIHSNKRFSYEDAQQVLDDGKGELHKELSILDTLAKKLRKERFKIGGFEFSSSELRFDFNEEGEPIGVKEKKVQDTNRLIEDYMLLANKYVSIYVNSFKPAPPFIYRVHDVPNPEKLTTLMKFVSHLGFKFNPDPDLAYTELNKLLTAVKDTSEEGMIQQMAIRTMSKAEYTTDNIGHYGLGFEFYSHFTSPIRRYPDVIAHRLLWKYLNDNKKGIHKAEIERMASHSSKMERKAVEAERASTKYMQAYYIKQFIGEEFDGVVSGVTKWGMYVTMRDNSCEGLVALKAMKGDVYAFSEEKVALVGLKKKREIKLGAEVRVKVLASDTVSREIDLVMV
ncbi:MAG: ribonuclease R [Patiriisocius sp.]|jgi:ribonuclease R